VANNQPRRYQNNPIQRIDTGNSPDKKSSRITGSAETFDAYPMGDYEARHDEKDINTNRKYAGGLGCQPVYTKPGPYRQSVANYD
jgi:hypothetical protein